MCYSNAMPRLSLDFLKATWVDFVVSRLVSNVKIILIKRSERQVRDSPNDADLVTQLVFPVCCMI